MENRNIRIIYICFFLSGAAGLSYEVLWSRILGLTFGHSVYAVTTVLSAFMGGLALGSHLFGKLADHFDRPLRLYGFIEIFIGLYCLAVPLLLSMTRNIYIFLYPSVADQSTVKVLLQFSLSFVVLIVPTTLMGGTLPVLSRALVSRVDESWATVAVIYGINIVGAALGAFAVGYWLIPEVGVAATNHIGVATNLISGGIILFMLRGTQFNLPEFEPKGEISRERTPLDHLVLTGLAVSGGVGMLYQIAWVRSLILVIGSSTYAFSAILVIFLVGLGMGSLVFKRLKYGGRSWFFPALQIGIGLSAFLLIPLFELLPTVFLLFIKSYKGSFTHVLFLQFLIVSTVILIPTMLMGMVFPCAVGILTRHIYGFGRDVGNFYACNTIGAVVGSILTGFLFIPHLGAHKTLVLGVIINLLIACSIFFVLYPGKRKVFIPIFIFIAAAVFISPSWDEKFMVSGVSIYPYRYFNDDASKGLKDIESEAPEVLYFREGISSTVAVVDVMAKGGIVRSLLINGKTDASDGFEDMETQVKLAAIPMLLNPRPRKVAIIGLGSGVTAGVAGLFSDPVKIDVIELEPAVVEASTYFSDVNFKPSKRNRVNIHVDDGRSFIEGTRDLFDIIVSEPPNPWMAGVADLFTVEFFEMSRRKLAPGGIFCQWVQGYNISPEDLKMIFRSFMKAFPDSSLWLGGGVDFLLIGRHKESGTIDLETLRRNTRNNNRFARVLGKYGASPVERLMASFLLGPEDLKAYSGEGPLNRDDRPLLEFLAPKSLYRDYTAGIRAEILSRKKRSYPRFIMAPELDTPEAHIKLGKYLIDVGRMDEASVELRKAPSLVPAFPSDWKEQFVERSARKNSVESFDGRVGNIPFFPRVGSYRPDETDRKGFASWSAFLDFFTRISGLVEGTGRDKSSGLVIKGVEGVTTVGYYAPFSVRPASAYRVEFWMKSDLETGGEGGVGIFEFDRFLPDEIQFDRGFLENHLIKATKQVTVKEADRWRRYSFDVHTSPRTRMIHFFLYGEGGNKMQRLVFDDVSFEEGR